MSSRITCERHFNKSSSPVTINLNYTGVQIEYIIKNAIVSGGGASFTFNYFRDLDFPAFATNVTVISVIANFTSSLPLIVSLSAGYLSVSVSGGVSIPPNGNFRLVVSFDRLISTGVFNSWIRNTNYAYQTVPNVNTTASTSNSLTLNLQNPGSPAISAGNSYAAGSGLGTVSANTWQTFTIYAVDGSGSNLTHGGGAFNVTMTGSSYSPRTMVDNGDGSYTANYLAPAAGSWTLNVTQSGNSIRDFPITITVI